MGKYKDLQKYFSQYLGDKTKKELEQELFYVNPELFNDVAKYRKYGVPKAYKKALKKFPVDENLFFFESNLARQYAGNPRYIYERMIELYPDFTYVWAYNGNKDIIPGNPIVVERKSEEYYEYLAKSGVVIGNSVLPIWYLRKETFYLQTWHGTPYKKLHWDVDLKNHEKTRDLPHFYVKSRGWNLLLTANHYSSEKFKSCFKYEGRILESGYPANDIFYNPEKYNLKRNEIREKLGISNDALVYLYAPTWGRRRKLKHEIDLLFDSNEFLNKAPDNSVLLVRYHYLSDPSYRSLINFSDKVIDVSQFDDIIELMCASDILITDYSSVVFDWYCSKKPVIYYVPDLEEYETITRGVYFDINEVNCGVVCKTEEELYENLNIENAPFYRDFYEKFCSLHKGNSSDKVIEFIINRNNPPKESILSKIKKALK